MPDHRRCRVCETALPEPFLDFGPMPLANAFLASPAQFADEPRFPLAVSACTACGLVQLTHVVPAEQLYRDYVYVSSTSDAVRAHADWLADALTARYGFRPESLIVEVASNDGTVLRAFQRRRVRVLGVEPARNIAALAEADGVATVPEFFDSGRARAVHDKHGPAACILGRHVFAHVDDVHDFLVGVETLLAPDGVLVIEVPYLGELIAQLEFDTIYHEHLSYFALAPIDTLCRRHGMVLTDVDRVGLHGGSVVLHIRRASVAGPPSERVERLLAEERASGLGEAATLAAFARRVCEWKVRLHDFTESLVAGGASLIGYGAAAKASTLLNYTPALATHLSCILDRSPHKHGRYTPGTHLLVEPVERWTDGDASHMVVLAWNFKDEIMRQMKPFADRGGRFVVPIPEPTVV